MQNIQKPDSNHPNSLKELHPYTQILLKNRFIIDDKDVQAFFDINLDDFNAPDGFIDMDKSVLRIREAIDKEELIYIFGDYDTDGIISAAYLYLILKEIGARVKVHLPNRFIDGYGMSYSAIDESKKRGAKLLITVDCGITAFEEVHYAKEEGIDVIITDHHQLKEGRFPASAYAVINPQDPRNHYSDKELTGAGVAFKLGKALQMSYGKNLYDNFDLIALATISDICVRKGENRIICKEGLKYLRVTTNTGLLALFEIAKCKKERLSLWDIGYKLGPRLNAAGRIDDPIKSFNLLIEQNYDKALKNAEELDRLNKDRQKIARQFLKEAENQADLLGKKDIYIVAGDGWNRGVTGLIASRLTKKYHAPVIVIAFDGNQGVGSARTSQKFPLYDLMKKASHLMEDFGGHESACGFSVTKDNLTRLTDELYSLAERINVDFKCDKSQKAEIDVSLREMNNKFFNELKELEPFGLGNPEPVFLIKHLKVKTEPRLFGRGKEKFWADQNGACAEVVIPTNRYVVRPNTFIDVEAHLGQRQYDGVSTWQLLCKKLHIA